MAGKKYILLVSLALAMLLADQISKYWVVANLTRAPIGNQACQANFQRFWSCQHPRPTRRQRLFDTALTFNYVENPGAAWGLFQDTDSRFRLPFFVAISIFAVGFIGFYYHKTPYENRILRTGLALVLGGALGNFVDRIRLTYVIDFIRMDFGFWPFHPWPTYNVADVAISVGVGLILIDGFFGRRHDPAAPEKEAT